MNYERFEQHGTTHAGPSMTTGSSSNKSHSTTRCSQKKLSDKKVLESKDALRATTLPSKVREHRKSSTTGSCSPTRDEIKENDESTKNRTIRSNPFPRELKIVKELPKRKEKKRPKPTLKQSKKTRRKRSNPKMRTLQQQHQLFQRSNRFMSNTTPGCTGNNTGTTTGSTSIAKGCATSNLTCVIGCNTIRRPAHTVHDKTTCEVVCTPVMRDGKMPPCYRSVDLVAATQINSAKGYSQYLYCRY